MIDSILLPESFRVYCNDQGKRLAVLSPIAKINIFVGSNNSGKSRFMRLLATQSEFEVTEAEVDLVDINNKISKLVDGLIESFKHRILNAAQGISVQSLSDFKAQLPNTITTGKDPYANARTFFAQCEQITTINNSQSATNMGLGSSNTFGLPEVLQQFGKSSMQVLPAIQGFSSSVLPKRVYIPILRGLRAFDECPSDIYESRTKKDYFQDLADNQQPVLFTGLSFFSTLTSSLLGSYQQRTMVGQYEEFLSRQFFEGRNVELIPKQDTEVVTIKIGKERERPVYELGDGIQSVIILSYLPFITLEPTIFFAEEPELHMHPGMQRKVFDLFNSSKDHMFFFTTHSNHLLDITIDLQNTAVFNFKKMLSVDDLDDEQDPTFELTAVDNGHISSLEELGVRNSSVFLVNATIWVEGITDRWYLEPLTKPM